MTEHLQQSPITEQPIVGWVVQSIPSAHAASDDACGNTYADDYTYTHSDSGAHSDTYADTNAYTDADSYPGAYHNVQLWQRSHLRI